jgi:predicted PolB exonuclease-like 3'-5' exonuclease
MRLPVLTFDIETQTDLKSGAHLFGLDLSEADLDQALTKLRRQDSGSDFQRLPLHEIVCISGLWMDELVKAQVLAFHFSINRINVFHPAINFSFDAMLSQFIA